MLWNWILLGEDKRNNNKKNPQSKHEKTWVLGQTAKVFTVLGYRMWLRRVLKRNLVFCFPFQHSTKGQNSTQMAKINSGAMEQLSLWKELYAGLAHVSAVTRGPHRSESSLALLHSWNINCTYFWGSLWRGNDDICNRLGACYIQYSSLKSHLRTASLPKWKSSGIRKGFPKWSMSFLKVRMVFTHY